MPRLRIDEVRVIPCSPGGHYQWVFLKIMTSEPGLYGIGSASNLNNAFTVATAIEKHLGPFWLGKDPDQIESLWHNTHTRSYWRNGTIVNNALSALDVALWDIKGKRAGMPVYQLLGGKVRDAVPLYGHADGQSPVEVEDSVRRFVEQGYQHVRAQMGGYGGGGFVPAGQGSRPRDGFQGSAFDEQLYVRTIPGLFEHLRDKLGWDVKLLHDVHEHLNPNLAMDFAKRMEPFQMFFVEDILPPEQIDWFEKIRALTSTPLAMGELFTHPREWLPLISNRWIDFIRCRLSQVGGITAGKEIATICEHFGVRTAWQEGGDNDPVNQLASYHVDLASASFGIQEENHFPPLVHDMLPGTAQLQGGYLYGNDTAGLGIDIHEELAKKHPLVQPSGEDHWTTVRQVDGSLVKP
ncbi:MAG: hypothetical protein A2W31_13055 [Planctomycetes bacterium RBG_16_64_10]|nr:MAG: hypothetical protein A2W31_13055 [Planctomycetes bacterium RBG_16_64_10]